jgi:hypothetical protein
MLIATEPARLMGSDGPTFHRVVGPDAAEIRGMLARMSGTTKFPGPSPASIMRADLKKLASVAYFAAEKTDGTRFALFLSVFRGVTVCIAFDRKLDPYVIPIFKIPTAMNQGTILDGEVAWNNVLRRWEFLIFDAVFISGIPVFSKSFIDRMESVRYALGPYEYVPSNDAFALVLKQFVHVEQFADVEAKLTSSAYRTDGLVFIPNAMPIVYGRHMDFFKWKTKHTLDFIVGDRRQLMVYDPGARNIVPFGVLRPSRKGSLAVKKGDVVECVLANDGATKTFDPVILRTDKSTANDILTATKTLENIRENISLKEICMSISDFSPPGMQLERV